MICVTAPSSGQGHAITTTDLRGARGTNLDDCTASFGGTSAAAPLVAGVTALVLEVNPALTWRDVQAVFIQSAKVINAESPTWQRNQAGLLYSHAFGFGLVDAAKAVQLARNWALLGPEISVGGTVDLTREEGVVSPGENFLEKIQIIIIFFFSFHCFDLHFTSTKSIFLFYFLK
jgi:subtilisin family serine protease